MISPAIRKNEMKWKKSEVTEKLQGSLGGLFNIK